MKRVCYLLLLFLVVNFAQGQDLAMNTSMTPPTKIEKEKETTKRVIEHGKKMYVSDKSHVYVQKSKKVYLWISNSADPNSKKEMLVTSGEAAEYFYLDTEGLNTIRSPWAVDPKTKQVLSPREEVVFNVYADGMAPVTQANFTGASKYFNNGKVYYSGGLSVSLDAQDRVSGTEKIYAAVANGEFSEYTGEMEFSNENENSITYYAIDHVGNVEDPTTKTFYVDKTAPTTKYIVTGDTEGNVLSANATIQLVSTDNLSDVKNTKFKVGEQGRYQTYTSAISLANLPDGEVNVSYFSVDNVNNEEQPLSTSTAKGTTVDGTPIGMSLYIDKIAPEVNFEIEGDQYKGKYTFVSERSKMKLVATDNKAGIEKVTFGINNSAGAQEYDQPFVASTSNALQYINYTAIDKVNNKAVNKSNLIYLDNTAPKSKISFIGKQVIERDSLFVTSDTKIKLTSVELESGLSNISYEMDNDKARNYNEAFSVAAEGVHQISYGGMDNVNNIEEANTKVFVVDNTPPEISHTLSFPAQGEREIDGQTYTVLPDYIKIYLAAIDKTTGVNNVWYRVNGGPIKEKNKIEYFKKGKFEIQIFAKDHLGNQSEETLRIIVE